MKNFFRKIGKSKYATRNASFFGEVQKNPKKWIGVQISFYEKNDHHHDDENFYTLYKNEDRTSGMKDLLQKKVSPSLDGERRLT